MGNKEMKVQNQNFNFIQGAVTPSRVVAEIQKHTSELQTGAYSLFLGQVRNDEINGKEVMAIEYSAYEDMVHKKFDTIISPLFDRHDIQTINVLHSLKTVKSGEISLMVLVTAAHRVDAMHACQEAVDLIKSELPIWGKEVFEEGGHVWKKNN